MYYFIQFDFPCGHVASLKRVRAPYKPIMINYGVVNESGEVSGFQIVETANVTWPLYCNTCFDQMECIITVHHQKRQFELICEAFELGWNESDIQGSLADIEEELRAEIQDFRTVSCQRRQADDFPYDNTSIV